MGKEKREWVRMRVRQKDQPFLHELRTLVKAKENMGFHTGLAFELLRFAQLGFEGHTPKEARHDAALFGLERERAMYVPVEFTELLVTFLTGRYGPPTEMKDELGRWMLPQGLLWIPKPCEGLTEVSVKCGDTDTLDKLERDFYGMIQAQMEKENEPDTD